MSKVCRTSDSDSSSDNHRTALTPRQQNFEARELLDRLENLRLDRGLSFPKLSVVVGISPSGLRKAIKRGTIHAIGRRKIENFLTKVGANA